MKSKCYKIIDSALGYNKRCGGLWRGSIRQCRSCEIKDLRFENIKLQNDLLKQSLLRDK